MAFSFDQKTLELIKKSRGILIVFKQDWTGDSLASSLALAEALTKAGKLATIVCDHFQASRDFSFLPTGQVQKELNHLRQFVIAINTVKNPIKEFHYEQEDEHLNIYLTPRDGCFDTKEIATRGLDYIYDLIIVLASPDLESLGDLYRRHREFFQKTAKINLDCSAKNEGFGEINLIDLLASSVAEIVYHLIKQWDEKLLDENLATWLLAGIISATKNFQTPNLSPQTLTLAGELINRGARRQEIVHALYQNRFLATLKLWGRILTRLNSDLAGRLIWSSINANDFLETASQPAEMPAVIEELITSLPQAEVIILFYEDRAENEQKIKGLIFSVKKSDSLMLAKKFNPDGNSELAKIVMENTGLIDAEREVIEEIKNKLDKPNN